MTDGIKGLTSYSSGYRLNDQGLTPGRTREFSRHAYFIQVLTLPNDETFEYKIDCFMH